MKIALLLHTGTASGGGVRALHAMMYACELKEAGEEAKLFFDGAGTGWIPELANPENRLHRWFLRAQELGVIGGVCDFCSGHHSDKAVIQQLGLPLAGEVGAHLDIVRLVREGYQIIVI